MDREWHCLSPERASHIHLRLTCPFAQFNTPVQLGPTSSTKPHDARTFTIPVQEDDILILASDGLSDNLWDADILDEVVRFRRSFMGTSASQETATPAPSATFRRSTLAGMLSEALCSRAKRVSETRGSRKSQVEKKSAEVDVPFAKRAREQGKLFEGGKPDGECLCTLRNLTSVANRIRSSDISVLVAVISPVE